MNGWVDGILRYFDLNFKDPPEMTDVNHDVCSMKTSCITEWRQDTVCSPVSSSVRFGAAVRRSTCSQKVDLHGLHVQLEAAAGRDDTLTRLCSVSPDVSSRGSLRRIGTAELLYNDSEVAQIKNFISTMDQGSRCDWTDVTRTAWTFREFWATQQLMLTLRTEWLWASWIAVCL